MSLGILNVGAGDTKLTFDPTNPAEMIRSGRIVTDMLRRGYALLIEVPDGNGGTKTVRAKEFREDISSYVIADFDPVAAQQADEAEKAEAGAQADEEGEQGQAEGRGTASAEAAAAPAAPRRKRYVDRFVPAAGTAGVAVARTSGG